MEHVRAYIELAVELGSVIQTTDPEKARAARPRPDRQSDHAAAARAAARPRPRTASAPPPAGTRARNRGWPTERLLDDHVGYRYAVLASRRLIEALPAATRARLEGAMCCWSWPEGEAAALSRRTRTPVRSSSDRTDTYWALPRTPAELDAVLARRPLAHRSQDISQSGRRKRAGAVKAREDLSWHHLVFHPMRSITSAA